MALQPRFLSARANGSRRLGCAALLAIALLVGLAQALDLPALGRDGLETLRAILAAHPGPCDAFLHLERGGDDHETIVALPSSLRVAATDQMVNAVEGVLGAGVTSFR